MSSSTLADNLSRDFNAYNKDINEIANLKSKIRDLELHKSVISEHVRKYLKDFKITAENVNHMTEDELDIILISFGELLKNYSSKDDSETERLTRFKNKRDKVKELLNISGGGRKSRRRRTKRTASRRRKSRRHRR